LYGTLRRLHISQTFLGGNSEVASGLLDRFFEEKNCRGKIVVAT